MELNMKISKLGRAKVTRFSRSPNSVKVSFVKRKFVQKHRQIKTGCRCLCNNHYDIKEYPKVLNELRQNKQLCDGVIHCSDGVSFQVHRAILAAISPYFKALFVNSLKGGTSELSEVTLDGVPSDILDLILDFAYTGRCKVNETNVERLLPIADRLDCVGVVQKCCQYLLEEMRPDNCLGIFKFARDYFCQDLQEKGWTYIRNSFMDVITNNPEFEDLTFEELYNLISDDQLNVRYEESVFDAISIWVNRSPQERKRHLYSLFQCVRFGFMSIDYFQSVVKNFPNIDEDTRTLLNTAEIVLESISNKHTCDLDYSHPLTRPRIPYEVLFAMGGWSAGSPTNFVETYDTRADRWFLSVHTDTMPRAYHGLVCLNNLIYMIGGFDGNDHFNTVRCFDPVKQEWSERACMYHARCYVSVCTLGGEIYAMGGFNGRTRMSSVEKYNPEKNQWQLMPSMNKQRSDASAATLNGKIYIAGGFNGLEVLSSAEVYDPQRRQWTFITPMSTARSGVSLVEHKGYLYALGGFNGVTRLNTGERYNPSCLYNWEPIPNMSCARSNFATVVTDDLIFAIGGFNGTTTIAYTECYDDEIKEWFEATPMNLNRSALAACICRGLPNCNEYSYIAKTSPLHSSNKDSPNNSGDGHAVNNTCKLNCEQ